jgi:hypothetical protein
MVLIGAIRNAYKVLVGKPVGKTSLGKPRRRWEENIKERDKEMWPDNAYRIH